MGDWADAVLQIMGEVPRGTGGLMYVLFLGAIVLLVFLAAYASGVKPETVEDREDPVD
jgi:hypothetical protein